MNSSDDTRKIELAPASAFGISPLLICVSPRARKRLSRLYRLNVEELEAESVKLYQELKQFEGDPADADFAVRVETLTKALITHHEKVQHAGGLLNSRVGNILVGLAQRALDRLKARLKIRQPENPIDERIRTAKRGTGQ